MKRNLHHPHGILIDATQQRIANITIAGEPLQASIQGVYFLSFSPTSKIRGVVMRISFASCWLLVLLTVVATAKAERSLANVSGRAKVDAKEENVDRRCAYLGRWGSFHLIGNGGSGAYQLGRDRYVADLTFASEDKSFWYYRPGNGDQATSLWAFERKLNCGCSWVWRKDGNGWHRYEFARAWGSGFGESIKRAAESTLSLEGLDSRLEQLEGRVDKLDGGKSFP